MSTNSMNKTAPNIVQAGRLVFGRFGYAKTTMADIAKQAGVTRQTVYNAFGSKDDILRAVIQEIGRETLEAVRAQWANDATVAEKLATFQRIGPLGWFKEVRAAPDWADMLEGLHTTATFELAQTEKEWVALLATMLRENAQDPSGQPIPLDDVSEFFFTSSMNAKYGVDDPDDMKKRLDIIREATMALLASRGYGGL